MICLISFKVRCGGPGQFLVDLPAKREWFYDFYMGNPGIDPFLYFKSTSHHKLQFHASIGEDLSCFRGVPGISAKNIIGSILCESHYNDSLFTIDNAPGVREICFEIKIIPGRKIAVASLDMYNPVEGEAPYLFSEIAETVSIQTPSWRTRP